MKNDRVKVMASIPLRRDDLQLHHIIRAVRLCSKLFEQSVGYVMVCQYHAGASKHCCGDVTSTV